MFGILLCITGLVWLHRRKRSTYFPIGDCCLKGMSLTSLNVTVLEVEVSVGRAIDDEVEDVFPSSLFRMKE